MSIIFGQQGEITRDEAFIASNVGGTPAEALISFSSPISAHWRQVIDVLLAWKAHPEQFDPEDQPESVIVDAAIDYAQDQIKAEQTEPGQSVSAPSSIIPSGSGRIAMEWNEGSTTVTIEFVAQGEGVFTRFKSGKIVERSLLKRNPRSRKLESRG